MKNFFLSGILLVILAVLSAHAGSDLVYNAYNTTNTAGADARVRAVAGGGTTSTNLSAGTGISITAAGVTNIISLTPPIAAKIAASITNGQPNVLFSNANIIATSLTGPFTLPATNLPVIPPALIGYSTSTSGTTNTGAIWVLLSTNLTAGQQIWVLGITNHP